MAHAISGLIGSPNSLGTFAQKHDLPSPTALPLGFAFLPIDHHEMEAIVGTTWTVELEDDEFATVQPPFFDEVRRCSEGATIVYLHTEYFGGSGGQAALVARDGAIVFGPVAGPASAINQALAFLGITDHQGRDAFDQIGLGRFRDNKDWRTA